MVDFERITPRPGVIGGTACIRGLRVTVGMAVGQIAAGRSIEAVPADDPYLEREDILAAMRNACAPRQLQARLLDEAATADRRRCLRIAG